MPLLNWKSAYAVDRGIIDRDHQQLFELINAFHFAYTGNHDPLEVARILNRLIIYAEEHFGREEAIMSGCSYPALAQHQQLHVELVESIFKLQTELEAAPIRMERDVVNFLRHWLLDHVLEHDLKLARFLALVNGGDAAV